MKLKKASYKYSSFKEIPIEIVEKVESEFFFNDNNSDVALAKKFNMRKAEIKMITNNIVKNMIFKMKQDGKI